MTDDNCPACSTGTLAAYKTKCRSTGLTERSRRCSCCGYRDIVLVRPAVILKRLRVVDEGEGINQPKQANSNE